LCKSGSGGLFGVLGPNRAHVSRVLGEQRDDLVLSIDKAFEQRPILRARQRFEPCADKRAALSTFASATASGAGAVMIQSPTLS
jgi:hypothetical protein